MNYQEILEELKWNSCSYAEEDCYNCNVEDKQACSNMRILCKQAAKMMEELKRERDAAVKCIDSIETYLQMGSAKYIDKTIKEWRGVQE